MNHAHGKCETEETLRHLLSIMLPHIQSMCILFRLCHPQSMDVSALLLAHSQETIFHMLRPHARSVLAGFVSQLERLPADFDEQTMGTAFMMTCGAWISVVQAAASEQQMFDSFLDNACIQLAGFADSANATDFNPASANFCAFPFQASSGASAQTSAVQPFAAQPGFESQFPLSTRQCSSTSSSSSSSSSLATSSTVAAGMSSASVFHTPHVLRSNPLASVSPAVQASSSSSPANTPPFMNNQFAPAAHRRSVVGRLLVPVEQLKVAVAAFRDQLEHRRSAGLPTNAWTKADLVSLSAASNSDSSLTTSVLEDWLFDVDHVLHPYPDDDEKDMLGRQSGLSRRQIDNWFVNARKRKWQPLFRYLQEQHIVESGAQLTERIGQGLATSTTFFRGLL
jgi:hypothetical protein